MIGRQKACTRAYTFCAMNRCQQTEFVEFYLPFGGKLSAENRWVKLAALVPWDMVEERYAGAMTDSGMGAPPLPGRVAFGALIIKERLGITDEETVEQIFENPYLQSFLGYRELLRQLPFDPSMMVHFRSRLAQDDFDAINARLIATVAPAQKGADRGKAELSEAADGSPVPDGNQATEQSVAGPAPKEPIPSGKLLMDATVTPADITYPTDLKLLNETREKLEHVIDELHRSMPAPVPKPRTYREKARRDIVAIAKQKRPGTRKIRKAIGQQLRYIRRDIGHIEKQVQAGARLASLKAYDYRCLLVAHEIYRQQEEMWREKKHRIEHRIVSLSQPWVRPIVRGKASAKVEFGAKISVSVSGGYASLHRLSWEAYNEGGDLVGQVESYRERHGHYPESVHADKIYRTRANRQWCQQRGIRLSGPPLGRPRRATEENAAELAAARAQARQDERDRIPVEGKFGNAKRGGTLARVMARLMRTSVSVINIGLIVLNLNTRLRKEFLALLKRLVRASRLLLAVANPPCWHSELTPSSYAPCPATPSA